MPVPDALSWYESALADRLNVPGISCDVKVTTSRLAPEPALGRAVIGGEFPFGARWHCGPGLHHLVPLDDAPQSIAWLTAAPRSTGREKARAWLAETLGFDLLAYDEFLFSLVLLVPNPVVRSFSSFIRDSPPPAAKGWA